MLVAAGCGLFLALANWQWDRAQSLTGDWQNVGYALQWPLFAVGLVAAWLRFLWLEQHHDPSSARPGSRERTEAPAPIATPAPAAPVRRSPAPRSLAARPTPEDDPDDELAAYNAYLARLAAEDRQR